MAGEEYTIADMAIWPWYGNLVINNAYEAAEFLQVDTYTNVVRWANMLASREAVQRGRIVNHPRGEVGNKYLNAIAAKISMIF